MWNLIDEGVSLHDAAISNESGASSLCARFFLRTGFSVSRNKQLPNSILGCLMSDEQSDDSDLATWELTRVYSNLIV